ncbi:hypothetical protein MTO96_025767 [Rhipicephalus appendiculatus]
MPGSERRRWGRCRQEFRLCHAERNRRDYVARFLAAFRRACSAPRHPSQQAVAAVAERPAQLKWRQRRQRCLAVPRSRQRISVSLEAPRGGNRLIEQRPCHRGGRGPSVPPLPELPAALLIAGACLVALSCSTLNQKGATSAIQEQCCAGSMCASSSVDLFILR